MKEKNFVNSIKVNLPNPEEKEVLRKIAGFDKKLQHKTYKNVKNMMS